MTNLTQEETDALLETLRRLKADREILIEAAKMQKERIEKLQSAITLACKELGVPSDGFPAPVATAYDILQKVLSEDALRGLNLVS